MFNRAFKFYPSNINSRKTDVTRVLMIIFLLGIELQCMSKGQR